MKLSDGVLWKIGVLIFVLAIVSVLGLINYLLLDDFLNFIGTGGCK